jgi:hypothetical protein
MAQPFDDQFKDKLSDYEEQPSDLSWIAVSTHLEAQQARQRRKKIVLWSAVAGLVLFALGGFFGLNHFSVSAPHGPSLASQQVNMGAPAWLSNTVHAVEPATTSETNTHPSQNVSSRAEQAANTVSEQSNNGPMAVVDMGHEPYFATLAPQTAVHIPAGPVKLHDEEPFLLEDGTMNKGAFAGFKVGLMGGLQSSALGGNVIDNYISDRQISRATVARPLFGVAARYDFSSSFGLETNVIISSGEGQLFENRGEYKNLSLNYIRIPVLASYHFANVGKTGRYANSLNLSAGLQYGRLNWVNLDDFGNDLEPSSFNTNELGLTGGISYDQYFSEDYLLTLGLRGSVNNHALSFPNLFDREKLVSYNLGLYLQLNYSIK